MDGKDLQHYRLAAGLTQQQLGVLLGYSEKAAERTVQHWENNRRKIPAKCYRNLREILRIPLEKLVP